MDTILVKDKHFVPYLSKEEIAERIQVLAQTLTAEYKALNPVIISVLNGAFIFTADLARALDFDPEIHFIRVSSYGDEMKSSGQLKKVIGLNTDLKGRHVIIVEDIVDLGLTVAMLRKTIQEKSPASIKVATLLFKEDAFRGSEEPEFIGFRIPNKFVVGFGLDYAQAGRNLDSIYQLKDE